MKRSILIIAVLFLVTGCPKEPSEQERLAQQLAELEATKSRKEFWQTAATVLGILTMLALAAGTVLGSKAKEDADAK